MAIKGNLGESSLADVLQLLVLGRKTGCLSVFEGSQFGRIYLDEGRITQASIVNRKDRLGDLLVRNGVIDSVALERAVNAQKGQNAPRLGEILLAQGALGKDDLNHFIRIQIEEAVYFLITWTAGRFQFDPDHQPESREILVSLDPERVLLEGARRVDEWTLIAKKIPGPDGIFGRASRSSESDPASITEEERRVLMLLDGRRSLEEVIEESGLLEFEATKALYGLVQAGVASLQGRKENLATDDGAEAAQDHLNLGSAFYQTGMLEEAERELMRALELDPGNWAAEFKIASIEIRTLRYRPAARRLMRLISDGRYAPSVFHNLALCLEAIGRHDHALLTTAEGLRSFPAHAGLVLSQAVLLTKQGKPRAALRHFDGYRALAPRGETPPVHFFVFSTLALAAAGRRPDAADRVTEGLRFYPRNAPLHLHAGLLLERDGRREEALESYQRALAEDADMAAARRALADLLFALGRFAEAAERYRELLDSGARSAEITFRLGTIAYRRGDRDTAIDYWRQTLSTDPAHARARARLELIGVEPAAAG